MVDQPIRIPTSINEALWPFGNTAATPRVFSLGSNNTKLLTVTTDDSFVRFVAFKGQEIVDWATVDLNEDGAAIPERMAEFGTRLGRQVADVPFYASLSRVIPKPDVGKRFVEQVVFAETAQTIPFDPSEVDVAWQEVDGSNGPEVSVTATPKRTVDARVQELNSVGISPTKLFSKSSALALAAGLPDAVVVHMTQHGADIVLVRDDIARFVHRVGLPSRDSADEYAATLSQGIDELTTFEMAQRNAEDTKEVDPIVLTGDVPPFGALQRAIQSSLGNRLRNVAQRVVFPEGFPANTYAANIGLALADWEKPKSRLSKGSEINSMIMDLLPERHQVHAVPQKLLRLGGLAAGLLLLVLLATFASGQARTDVELLEKDVQLLQREARLSGIEAAKVNSERLLIDTIAQNTTSLTNTRAITHGQVTRTIELIRNLTIDSPIRRVKVASANVSRGTVKVEASGSSVSQALAYGDFLRGTGLFTDVEIPGMNATESGATTSGVKFSLSAAYDEGSR